MIATHQFNAATINNNTLLTENDPAPFTYHQGTSNIFLTFPHAGITIPENLKLDDYFLGRHEFTDLGTNKLAQKLIRVMPNAYFLVGEFSRLAADLNRTEKFMIDEYSQENRKTIKMNTGVTRGTKQWQQRHDEIYVPYHAQFIKTVQEIKRKHGSIMLLDLHSFSPDYNDEPREQEIGTLYCKEGTISRSTNETLSQIANDNFKAQYPYPAFPDSPCNKGSEYAKSNLDIEHVLIEIRNDVLSNEIGVNKAAEIMKQVATNAQAAVHIQETARRPQMVSPIPPRQQPQSIFVPASA